MNPTAATRNPLKRVPSHENGLAGGCDMLVLPGNDAACLLLLLFLFLILDKNNNNKQQQY
jgi:hypothetical protein